MCRLKLHFNFTEHVKFTEHVRKGYKAQTIYYRLALQIYNVFFFPQGITSIKLS